MTNKRKKEIRALGARLGIRRRAAASRFDADGSKATSPVAHERSPRAPYAGPRGDAAPPVPLRELWACASAGVVTCDGDSGGWSLVEPPPPTAPADLVARCRTAPYLEAMDKNNWAVEARYALAQIARDIGTAYAESIRSGRPSLCPSTAPTPPAMPLPGKPVAAAAQFASDPGWRSILFSMSHPVQFQYRIDASERAYAASARGMRRERDGGVTDVTVILRGRLDDSGELWTSAVEETWVRRSDAELVAAAKGTVA